MKSFGQVRVQIERNSMRNSNKHKKTEKRNPGPREYGSWIIQTYQGRWIDPVPNDLDQTVEKQGPGVNQTGSNEPVWFMHLYKWI